jgi:hypothetical protein
MTATTASDPYGVQYYFHCTTTGGHDSAWQDSPTFTDTGLTPSTTYSYTVSACDAVGNCSAQSDAVSVTTPTPSCSTCTASNYVQRAYVAYYGRPADPAGLAYWASRMDAEGGSLSAIIAAFGSSGEFNRRYGGLSTSALVTKIYQQALGRDPDTAGLAYYVGELQAGRRTLAHGEHMRETCALVVRGLQPAQRVIRRQRADVADDAGGHHQCHGQHLRAQLPQVAQQLAVEHVHHEVTM